MPTPKGRKSAYILMNPGVTVKLAAQLRQQRATHNKYFKEFAALTLSVENALTYFAPPPEEVLGLFGRYCEESGLELKQAA
jgi:hypothetical protein